MGSPTSLSERLKITHKLICQESHSRIEEIQSEALSSRNFNGFLDGSLAHILDIVSGFRWSVDQETGNLNLERRHTHLTLSDAHLSDGIESRQTDVGIREGLGAGLNLSQNLRGVLATKHRKLPHSPVSVVDVVLPNTKIYSRQK